ncbi:hypothetical protein IE81DRAFT_315345 [Ceraceosorus guamensis]|uniref:Inositol-phosphate phosphatase n=1 Tax=Ceraceosorus guamensis TaxID=1522189 RepID=A0A316VWI4_9BASI|nr:hypothetical protein IE81DRAFT_315345 [Ceraceosorus guamensis]PWN41308.1 hypothetical protein IE81DRAFT_315345 [Ceraceosorus guamensis]
MASHKTELEELHDFALHLALSAGEALRGATASQISRTRGASSSAFDYPYPLGEEVGLQPSTSQTASASSHPTWDEGYTQEEKAGSTDLVTSTDLMLERLITDRIRQRYPDHHILAEEAYAKGGSKEWKLDPTATTWIIDPLDGTVNYVHGNPLVCISLSVVQELLPVVGVVYAPMLGRSGTLSFEPNACPPASSSSSIPNVQRLPLQPRPLSHSSSEWLFASEWGKDRRDVVQSSECESREDLKGAQLRGLRSYGSAALDLTLCAAASVDIVWEGAVWEWDISAALLLLLESGGVWTDANGPSNPHNRFWSSSSSTDQPVGADLRSKASEERLRLAIQEETYPNAGLPRASLGARRILAIRGATGPDAHVAQRAAVHQVWKRTQGLEYRRMGVRYAIEEEDAKTANAPQGS